MSESFGWDSDEVRNFRSGLWKHYKGGLYSVIALVTHHETRRPMVLYVSHTYGGNNVRPLRGWEGDQDGWLDEVEVVARPSMSPNVPDVMKKVPRFAYVGELPSDVKIVDRVVP